MPTARHLLVASLSLLAAGAAAQTHYAWVGTYNPNGEGLYRFTVDSQTGALRDKALVAKLPNLAQLAVSADGKTLYAASEVDKGVVQAWRIGSNGELSELNQVASGGAGPVYLSLTPDGRHLLVANYAFLNELSDEERAIFEEGFQIVKSTEQDAWEDAVAEAKDKAENEQHVNFIYPDTAPFQEAMAPLHDSVLAANPELQPIYDLIQQHNAAHTAD